MKKTIASICAIAVTAVSLAAALPANAAQPVGGAQFLQVANYNNNNNHNHGKFEMRGKYAYYNGHRGDHIRHPGWNEYNGYWFPPSAFIGAAIGAAVLGGIIHATR